MAHLNTALQGHRPLTARFTEDYIQDGHATDIRGSEASEIGRIIDLANRNSGYPSLAQYEADYSKADWSELVKYEGHVYDYTRSAAFVRNAPGTAFSTSTTTTGGQWLNKHKHYVNNRGCTIFNVESASTL